MTDNWRLDVAYGATLVRIKEEGGEGLRLGIAASMWISHSGRALKGHQLCHPLGGEIGSPDIHDDNVPSISTLLAFCKGIITIDKKASTLRLNDFTL